MQCYMQNVRAFQWMELTVHDSTALALLSTALDSLGLAPAPCSETGCEVTWRACVCV